MRKSIIKVFLRLSEVLCLNTSKVNTIYKYSQNMKKKKRKEMLKLILTKKFGQNLDYEL